jgi:hypothetical protein
LHVPVSDDLERLADLVGRRNMAASAGKAPGAHERADGHIEGTFTCATVLDAIGQEAEQFRRDCDRVRGRITIDTAPLARRPVIGKQAVQAVDFLKRCIHRIVHGCLIGSIEDDGKRRPHRVRASFQLQRSGFARQQNRGQQDEGTAQDCSLGSWFFQKAS